MEYITKGFINMDLLRIFRMQEPVPEHLLLKTPETVIFQKCSGKQTKNRPQPEMKNPDIKMRGDQPRHNGDIIKQYESLYSKMITDSEIIVKEKQECEIKLKEMENFCQELMEKYEKARCVIEHFEEMQRKLKNQVQEYEGIIKSLTDEYGKLKECMHGKLGATKLENFKELPLSRNSMFEPLKGLGK